MGLEIFEGPGKYLLDMVITNPTDTPDQTNELDNHIRGVKNVLRNTFPAVNAALNFTPAEANALDGILAVTNELNVLFGGTVSTVELNKLAGALITTVELNYLQNLASGLQAQLNGYTPPAAPTGHTRCGNLYLANGSDASVGGTARTFGQPKNITRTAGPTGSGEDFIWADLDDLPSGASSILAEYEITCDMDLNPMFPADALIASLQVGAGVSPVPSLLTIFRTGIEMPAANDPDENQIFRELIEIPIDGDKKFTFLKSELYSTDGFIQITLTYRGYRLDIA